MDGSGMDKKGVTEDKQLEKEVKEVQEQNLGEEDMSGYRLMLVEDGGHERR